MSQLLKRASSSMASSSSSLASLSSLLFSKPHHRSNPNPSSALSFPIGRRTMFKCSANSDQKRERVGDSEGVEKKSFAVATGELFIGLASKFVRRGRNSYYGNDQAAVPSIKVFDDDEEREYFSRRRRRGDGRVAKMIEEEQEGDDREIIWEQRGTNVDAEKKRKKVTSPGFSFSAAGLLFPYHLGVAQFLIEKGYITETTPLAGSSAGAIVSVVIASGGSMLEALEATKILAEDCRNNGTAFRLGAVLRDVLDRFLPDDAHIRSNGRVRVGVTQLLWRPRGLLVDQFESKEDLINAVFTSSFIPGYLAPRPATLFRERLCIDGGLTMLMPPTSASKTVRVCAFPATLLGFKGIGISPHCNPENRAGGRELFQWALEPAEDDVLDHLFGLGYMDAATWAKQNPVEEILENESSHEESLN